MLDRPVHCCLNACCAVLRIPWCSPQELLDSSGLGHVTHLTRTEWSVLRGALGKPRRLSLAFLKQERQKLEAYRCIQGLVGHTWVQEPGGGGD